MKEDQPRLGADASLPSDGEMGVETFNRELMIYCRENSIFLHMLNLDKPSSN